MVLGKTMALWNTDKVTAASAVTSHWFLSPMKKYVSTMSWAGHVARMGRRGIHTGYWWEIQKERNEREDQDVGAWTILKWIFER
jgi:hypothetical protein